MTDDEMQGATCRYCGGKLEFVGRARGFDTFRCSTCGREQFEHPTLLMDDVYKRLGPRGRLIVQWSSIPPGPKDALGIRQLVPKFKDKSFREVLEEIRELKGWVFEDLTRSEARELESQVVKAGLVAVIEFPE